MEYSQIFSQRLSEILREKNISQKQLAEAVGVKPATISSYIRKYNDVENGKTPSFNIIMAISKYLNVSVDWLCGLDNEKQDKTVVPLSELFKQFIDIIQIFNGEIVSTSDVEICSIEYCHRHLDNFLTQYKALLILRDNNTLSEDLYDLAVKGLLQKYDDITFDYTSHKFSDGSEITLSF